MDKLKMAHDWAMKYGSPESLKLTVDKAWKYADAMQAEADKRSISLTKDQEGNCLHFHHEFGHKKCMDCGASLDEWQPDWSVAPSDYDWWAVDQYGSWWFDQEPKWIKGEWGGYVLGKNDRSATRKAPNFNYQGAWQDSLRKRPNT